MLKIAWFCSLFGSLFTLGAALFSGDESKIGEIVYDIFCLFAILFIMAFCLITVVLILEGLFITVG